MVVSASCAALKRQPLERRSGDDVQCHHVRGDPTALQEVHAGRGPKRKFVNTSLWRFNWRFWFLDCQMPKNWNMAVIKEENTGALVMILIHSSNKYFELTLNVLCCSWNSRAFAVFSTCFDQENPITPELVSASNPKHPNPTGSAHAAAGPS